MNVTLAFEDATYKVVNILPDFDISAKENIGFGNSLVRKALTHKKIFWATFHSLRRENVVISSS